MLSLLVQRLTESHSAGYALLPPVPPSAHQVPSGAQSTSRGQTVSAVPPQAPVPPTPAWLAFRCELSHAARCARPPVGETLTTATW